MPRLRRHTPPRCPKLSPRSYQKATQASKKRTAWFVRLKLLLASPVEQSETLKNVVGCDPLRQRRNYLAVNITTLRTHIGRPHICPHNDTRETTVREALAHSQLDGPPTPWPPSDRDPLETQGRKNSIRFSLSAGPIWHWPLPSRFQTIAPPGYSQGVMVTWCE